MVFTLRDATVRLIAVIVLLSGMADYLAFDVGDPLAPMSAAGTPGLICSSVKLSPPTVLPTDAHDDGCIGCAAGFTAHRVKLLVAEVIATSEVLCILPPSDPPLARINPPPRA
jgi:hypothetical protein